MEFQFDKKSGLFRIQKSYARSGGYGHDISGPYWILMRLESLDNDLVRWRSDGSDVYAQHNISWAFIPAFSWCAENGTKGLRISVDALISDQPIPGASLKVPTLFNYDGPLPTTIAEVTQCLDAASDPIPIPLCSRPRAVCEKLKNLIDRREDRKSLGDLAKALRSSPAALTRAFKADFGFPPIVYRRGLRVTIGMVALMSGVPIAEAAAQAGYNDLSRFNKQFRQYLRQSPKAYKLP